MERMKHESNNVYREHMTIDEHHVPIDIRMVTHRNKPAYAYLWHYHPETEFHVLKEGLLIIETQSERYTLSPGDVVIIGSSKLHRVIFPNGYAERIICQLSLRSFLSQATVNKSVLSTDHFNSLSSLNYILKEKPQIQKKIRSILMRILSEITTKESGYDFAICHYVNQILFELIRNDNRNLYKKATDSKIERLWPLLEYINDHLAEDIHVKDLLQIVNFQYNYFFRVFKQTLGVSFKEYIHQQRIFRAEQLLLTEGYSIETIAQLCGFATLPNFYTIFKRYHNCTPAVFRKKAHEATYK